MVDLAVLRFTLCYPVHHMFKVKRLRLLYSRINKRAAKQVGIRLKGGTETSHLTALGKVTPGPVGLQAWWGP